MRKRLSSSSSGGKLIIVYLCSPEELSYGDNPDEFHVHLIDTDEEVTEFTSRPPTLRFNGECLAVQAFCVLGSTLYLFGSPVDAFPHPSQGWAAVYTFNLSSVACNHANRRLRTDDLVKIQDMHTIKILPTAVPTPDGKRIVVFSSTYCKFTQRTRTEEEDALFAGRIRVFDFEMYDPVLGSWVELARVPESWRVADFDIELFTFISDDVMLFHTGGGYVRRTFTVDLRAPGQFCQEVTGCPRAGPWFPDGCYIEVQDGFYLSPSAVGGEFSFCDVQGYLEPGTNRAHLIADIWRFDPERKREATEEGLVPTTTDFPILTACTLLKSFKFLLHVEHKYGVMFRPFYLGYVPSDQPL